MLKIRDGIDLKELEKYGITPRYDEFTGKIKKYVNKDKGLELYYRSDKSYWYIQAYCSLDLLYDLIKADLVEKVSDE